MSIVSPDEIKRLEKIARKLRVNTLKMLTIAGSGHPGGSLSSADIITVLFFYKMKLDPKNPEWEERDRFILSKGHCAPILYSALAELGYFPYEWLWNLRKVDWPLQGHPDRLTTPGVEMSTGSLGQGLSIANGIALGLRLKGVLSKVYVLLGDGELQEGQIWEAAMTSSHYKLDNLCAIVDYNGLQIDGFVKDIKSIEPLRKKWDVFGWYTIEINGHEMHEIINALNKADKLKERPTVIIAHTIKGKGVSFMENKVEYHGVSPTKEELERALKELEMEDE
ncbi:MAG: transketolase [Candidatus Aminicenantia bacterium]